MKLVLLLFLALRADSMELYTPGGTVLLGPTLSCIGGSVNIDNKTLYIDCANDNVTMLSSATIGGNLGVNKDIASTLKIHVRNNAAGANAKAEFAFETSGGTAYIGRSNANAGTDPIDTLYFRDDGSGPFSFKHGDTGVRLHIGSDGNAVFTGTFTAHGDVSLSTTLVTLGGKVGVGTTSPLTTLDVNGAATVRGATTVSGSSLTVVGADAEINGTGNPLLTINATAGINDSASVVFKDGTNQHTIGKEAASGGILTGSVAQALVLTANNSKPIQFGTNDAVRMTVADGGNVGVGTANPATKLHMSSGTLTVDGTAPKIRTGASTDPALSSCGTTPAITGSDLAGKVTIGSGVTTSCTVTFAASYVTAPACTIAGDNTAVTYAATTSATVLTITSSADMASDVISYICIGVDP